MTSLEAKSCFTKFNNFDFRIGQKEAIDFIINSKKKIVVIQAPTGAGKSLIGLCAGRVNGSMTYLVSTKSLQTQITDDFPEAVSLFGRSNYRCKHYQRITYDNCPDTECFTVCEYKRQRNVILESDLRILNYAYFLNEVNYVGRFSDVDMLICDEADMLEHQLSNFINLNISEHQLKSIGAFPPKYKTTVSKYAIIEWKEWAGRTTQKIGIKLAPILSSLNSFNKENMDSDDHKELQYLMKQKNKLATLNFKLKLFLKHVDNTWIREEKRTQYGIVHNFTLTWLTQEITKQYFLRHITGKLVLISATFPPMQVLAKTLGVEYSNIEYMELESSFPSKNKPIHLQPVGTLSYKEYDKHIDKVLDAVKDIVAKYPNDKGLIHTVSYKIRDVVMKVGNGRFVTHNQKDRLNVIENFKSSTDPLVLVSPSAERGVSLDNDLCRFIIIVKAPFLSLADKKVQNRLYASGNLGKFWYRADAIMTLVQMAGRGVRNQNDYCDVYVIEKNAVDLIVNNISNVPKSFRECIVY